MLNKVCTIELEFTQLELLYGILMWDNVKHAGKTTRVYPVVEHLKETGRVHFSAQEVIDDLGLMEKGGVYVSPLDTSVYTFNPTGYDAAYGDGKVIKHTYPSLMPMLYDLVFDVYTFEYYTYITVKGNRLTIKCSDIDYTEYTIVPTPAKPYAPIETKRLNLHVLEVAMLSELRSRLIESDNVLCPFLAVRMEDVMEHCGVWKTPDEVDTSKWLYPIPVSSLDKMLYPMLAMDPDRLKVTRTETPVYCPHSAEQERVGLRGMYIDSHSANSIEWSVRTNSKGEWTPATFEYKYN